MGTPYDALTAFIEGAGSVAVGFFTVLGWWMLFTNNDSPEPELGCYWQPQPTEE